LNIASPSRFSLLFAAVIYLAACAQETQRRSDANTYLDDANKALVAGKCWNAQELFRNLLSDFPGSHLVDDAQYGLGQAYFCSKDYETAIFEFERLINEYPVSKFVDMSRFQIGMCYFNQSRSIHHDQEETVRAIQEFTRFVEDFPNSDLAPDARKRIGDLEEKLAEKDLMIAENYLKWKNPGSSEIFCRRVLEKYPKTRITREVRFILARALHLKGDLNEALEILEELILQKAPGAVSKAEVEAERDQVRKALSNRGDESAKGVSSDARGGAGLPGA
jgi:outer membrane protein assembly factor BamD